MKIAILYLTKNGRQIAEKIQEKMQVEMIEKEHWKTSLSSFLEENFNQYEGFLFIMATGIVVRMIAPLLKNKAIDPAVVVLDEKGQFAISLLSGHLGGANQLATKIAQITGGQPVITTATDVNQVLAFDIFAKEQNCFIENLEELKYISGAMVEGEKVGLFLDQKVNTLPSYLTWQKEQRCNVLISNQVKNKEELHGHVLKLVPKNLVLGIGCKKNVPGKEIEQAIFDFLEKQNRKYTAISCIASIELKKEEKGIRDFSEKWSIPFLTLTKEQLEKVEGEFFCSAFVKEQIGVGSVCEACAVYAKKNSRLLAGKTIYPGITLALGEIIYMYKFV